ncbi:MAG: DUF4830 domain-containing protein [Clostridia bacterium]|nr:DUF4830 domain-containing protein [Clostridia bacterium]
MFVYSCKTNKTQLFWAVICILLLGGILITLTLWPEDAENTATRPASALSVEDGIRYLKSLGYTVTAGETKEVQVPEEFDDTLTAYNEQQKTVGFDLTPYRGKRLQCRTYTVENFPGEEQVEIHLYLYKDKIVAGDMASTAAGGFQLPLQSTPSEE